MAASVPRILIIAGSDSGGGAGIQADIKTVTMLGGHAMTAVTALTAQNTLGVAGMMPVRADFVRTQIDAVVEDIGIDAIKIGMIGAADVADLLIDWLPRAGVPVVLDPVMVATSGAALADADVLERFARLMPLATVVTPNIPELEALTGERIVGAYAQTKAARKLARTMGCAVFAKGGHGRGAMVIDSLVEASGAVATFEHARIDTPHTHGTGCTLASALAVGLAQGRSVHDAAKRARDAVLQALAAAPGLGGGHGPMGHFAIGRTPDSARREAAGGAAAVAAKA